MKKTQYSRPSLEEIEKKLSKEQYYVTQENGTEAPFTNQFDQHFEKGIYVDIVSGEPLFSSLDKFDSGCGWPAFSRPLDDLGIVEKEDSSYGMSRVEVRSKYADSHLGHVFNDGHIGPKKLRYCINSASLRFIPYDSLEKEGYGDFKSLFEGKNHNE